MRLISINGVGNNCEEFVVRFRARLTVDVQSRGSQWSAFAEVVKKKVAQTDENRTLEGKADSFDRMQCWLL